MKTDLAPKFMYYSTLFFFAFSITITSILHLFTSESLVQSGEFFPFISTSVAWGIQLLAILFVINKCRYILINPVNENKLIIGNPFYNSHGMTENLVITKKVWTHLFKVTFEGKDYYVITSHENVDEFNEYKKH